MLSKDVSLVADRWRRLIREGHLEKRFAAEVFKPESLLAAELSAQAALPIHRRQIDRSMGAGKLGFPGRLGHEVRFSARGFHRNTFGSGGDSRGTGGLDPGWQRVSPRSLGKASGSPIRFHIRASAHDLAARCARGLQEPCPSQTEGAGKAGCALHPRSRVQLCIKNAHTSIQVQRRASGLPCAVVYGLLRALPGERLFCHRRNAGRKPSAT